MLERGFVRCENHLARSYELEKGLIDGSIEVDDLPKLWAEKMEQYLGGFLGLWPPAL